MHNCHSLEAIMMSFNRLNEQIIIEEPDNKILSSAKKKWVIKPWKDMEGTQMSISK